MKTCVYITFEKRLRGICAPAALIKRCCTAAAQAEGVERDCEVSVLVTDSECVRGLNKAYRGIDRTTDVLSFPLFDRDGDPIQLGDIVLNRDRIFSQAQEYGHSPDRELCFLTVHSMMHLLGYDHEEDDDRRVMRTHEEAVLDGICPRD